MSSDAPIEDNTVLSETNTITPTSILTQQALSPFESER